MLLDPLAEYREAIEQELRGCLRSCETDVAPLYGMLHYHLGWVGADMAPLAVPQGGKRVRPLLCLLANAAAGGEWRQALPAAAAIELTHCFSLIHDDIEDDSPERHHRATVWKQWGLAHGVNSGDTLWALARLSLHTLRALGHSDALVLEVVSWLDRTCLYLCMGQFLDLEFERRSTISEDEYLRMIEGKTAALISAATGIGARLAGAPVSAVSEMKDFGRHLGLAFQITDDLLGVWGDPTLTGKPSGDDIRSRKKTLPVAHAFRWEAEHGLDDLERALAQRGEVDVSGVLALLDRAGSRAYCEELAARHHSLAAAHLTRACEPTLARAALISLVASLLGRQA